MTLMNLVTRMRALKRDESGQDLLEYALLVALIAIVCFVAVQAAGNSVNSIFSTIAGSLAALA